MKTIWKFELKPTDIQEVVMPKESQVIHVGVQRGNQICVWAMVNPKSDPIAKRFYICGTGYPVPDDDMAVCHGSVQIQQTWVGELVFHIFERIDFDD